MARTMRRWTDAEMALCLNDERSDEEVASEVGRSAASVKRMRERIESGWTPKAAPPLDPTELQFIAENPGMTAHAVAAALGVAYGAVTHARRRIARDQGVDFGRGPYDKNPSTLGSRFVLAKTCMSCGYLLGGRHFSRAGNGRGLKAHCHDCRALQRPPADHAAQERRVEEMVARDPLLPAYASRRYFDYTSADVDVLGQESLTVIEQAAKLGRTYAATSQARKEFGLAPSREERTEPGGLWRITLADDRVSA